EFARRAPRLPPRYEAQRYPTMVHQAGLEDEGPGIPYPDDGRGPRRIMPERELKENMVLCLECYVGETGAPFGVKLEDGEGGTGLVCGLPCDGRSLWRGAGRGVRAARGQGGGGKDPPRKCRDPRPRVDAGRHPELERPPNPTGSDANNNTAGGDSALMNVDS